MQTDRGWAWVVLAASMGGNLLVGVLCYFVGVIHTGLLHQFHASVTTTAWVGALYSSNISLASPLASVLINRYGCRVCCVLGGLLCFAGFTASAFVTTMPLLFVTYGLMAGLGLGLCLSPTIVTVGFYFDKYRSLAAGMSMSSTAVGILGGSLIAQTLIDEYSVSGAFLLIAAISLHYCFCGMFYRPTPFERRESKIVETDQHDADREWEMKGSRISLALHGVEIKSVSLCSVHGNEQIPRPGYGSVTSLLRKAQLNGHDKSLENGSLAGSVQSGEVFVRHRTSNPALVRGEDAPSNAHYNGFGVTNKSDRNHIAFEKLNTSSHCNLDVDCDRNHQIPEIIISSDDQEAQGKSHSMIDNSHSNKAKKNGTVTNGHQVSKTRNDVTDPDDDTGCRVPHQTEISTDHDDMCYLTSQEVTKSPGKLRGHRNDEMKRLKTADSYWQVLTNKAFMFHCASTMASSLHVAGVYLHLPEYVHTKGTSPTQGAALFIAVGVMSLVSRLAAGFATMEPKIDPLTLNLGMMGLCGISTIFFPYYSGKLEVRRLCVSE
ncbi:hypothetical protein V1264_009893 [Littorina saxatilis]|uniref:Monocarboxylate transporter n=1 Tax=Littorina saxatilis TaxID=31220 RepID=A0AAN9AN83_9CAEN